MMITTTMMMMVMDQFEDLGVVLCRPSRLISKVIAYGEHGSKLRPAQSTRWNIIATSCTMNFSLPRVLPILVMYPPPHPPVFLWKIQQFLYTLFVKLICIHTLLLCKLICDEHGYWQVLFEMGLGSTSLCSWFLSK